MQKFPLLLILLTYCISSAQNFDYQAIVLDKELTRNADAVMRLDQLEVNVEAHDLMREKTRQIITVLNENGNRSVAAYKHYEKDDRIVAMEAVIYDASGKEIKKFRKKDFLDASAVSGGQLYTDSRVKYLNFTPVSYPYTIDFYCEFESANTAFLPQWAFIGKYRTSVEKSLFQVNFKPGLTFKIKEYNFDGYDIEVDKSESALFYKADHLKAIKREALAPPIGDYAPWVRVGLNRFHLEGVDGRADSWQEFGKWVNDELLAGRDAIDPETITEVRALVKDVEDPYEKIDKVYNYVQSNTRYVGVQMGIGGWQPISAEEVDRVKYGDCKGLTNYTMALLKAVDIESYYILIFAGKNKRDLDEDFVGMQGNHAILNIPLESGDVWLECTSQVKPTNFHGSFTDDRVVLRVKPEGGEIIRTPAFSVEDNLLKTRSEYHLDNEGSIKGEVVVTTTGVKYDERFRLERSQQKEIEEFYKEEWDYVNNLVLSKPEFANDRQKVRFEEKLQIEVPDYGTVQNEQILFAPNIVSRKNRIPKRYRSRKLDFVIDRGYMDESECVIHLPDGYAMEGSIADQKLESEYGNYNLSIEQISPTELLYKRSFMLKPGRYSNEAYDEYRNFRRQVAKLENSKIVIAKS